MIEYLRKSLLNEEEISKTHQYRQRGRVWSPICNVVVVFPKRTDNADKVSWPARMYPPCPRRVWSFTCSAIGFRPRQNGYLLLKKDMVNYLLTEKYIGFEVKPTSENGKKLINKFFYVFKNTHSDLGFEFLFLLTTIILVLIEVVTLRLSNTFLPKKMCTSSEKMTQYCKNLGDVLQYPNRSPLKFYHN